MRWAVCAVLGLSLLSFPAGAQTPTAIADDPGDDVAVASAAGGQSAPPGSAAAVDLLSLQALESATTINLRQHVPLRRQANDTSVQVGFEWSAANPTLEWLRFRVVEDEQMGGHPSILEWNGQSPQSLTLVGDELEAMPESFYVQVSATGCIAEMPAGLHIGPDDQPVEWRVAWNTHT